VHGDLNAIDEPKSELPPPPPRGIDLLEELAVILRRLTWSQMQEFCAGIKKDEPKDVHDWSIK
jgi:hypothetical protein